MKNKFEKFSVRSIEYDDDRKISALSIVNSDGSEVFRFPKNGTKKPAAKSASASASTANPASATASAAKPAPNKPREDTKPMQAPVITGSMEDNTLPWENNPQDEITQDMLTEIIGSYVRDKDTDERRRLTKEVKRMNNGSADYKHIADPNVRREIYNYFWNLGNFQQERTA